MDVSTQSNSFSDCICNFQFFVNVIHDYSFSVLFPSLKGPNIFHGTLCSEFPILPSSISLVRASHSVA